MYSNISSHHRDKKIVTQTNCRREARISQLVLYFQFVPTHQSKVEEIMLKGAIGNLVRRVRVDVNVR